jgi:peptidase M50B-like protein
MVRDHFPNHRTRQISDPGQPGHPETATCSPGENPPVLGYGVAAFAGYVGPSAAGLLAAWLISIGHIVAVLWLGGLLLVVMVLMVRNFFGGIVILACGALLYLVLRHRLRPASRPP